MNSQRPTRPLSMPLIRERLEQQLTSSFARELRTAKTSRSPELSEGAADKRAAVATVLREGPLGPEVLLIRRAEDPRDPWSGHMAFPGGREDPIDVDLEATAVRETLEEIALDLRSHGRLIGHLEPLPAMARGRRAGITISPFVFELVREPAYVLNAEVAETLWAPLQPLMQGQLATTIPYEIGDTRLVMPGYDVGGRVVWGLTYRMLQMLFERLR